MSVCGNCGDEVTEGSRFCGICGRALSQPQGEQHEQAGVASPPGTVGLPAVGRRCSRVRRPACPSRPVLVW